MTKIIGNVVGIPSPNSTGGGGTGGAVLSVNDKTGVVVLKASDVGAISDELLPRVMLAPNKNDVYTKTEVDSKLSSVYKYKGTLDYYFNLPINAEIGDVYNIRYDSGENYTQQGYKKYDIITVNSLTNLYQRDDIKGVFVPIEYNNDKDDLYEKHFKNKDTIEINICNPNISITASFTLPIFTTRPEEPTSCVVLDESYCMIFINAKDGLFSGTATNTNYETYYDQIIAYLNGYPNSDADSIMICFNKEMIYSIEEPYIVSAGDNVAWTGTEWDVLAGTIDLNSYVSKKEISNVVSETEINPVSGKAVNEAIKNAISTVYKFKGSIRIESIQNMDTLAVNIGDVYNLTNSGIIENREVIVMGDVLSVNDGLTTIRATDSSLNEIRNQYYTSNVIIQEISENYNVVGTQIDSETNTVKFYVENTGLSVGSSIPIGYLLKGFNVIKGDNIAWDGVYWDKLAGTIDLSNYYTKEEVDSSIQATVQEYVNTAILNGEW